MLADDDKITDKEKEKLKYDEFLNGVKIYGYEMKASHSGNDYDNWYNLIIPINDFDLAKIKKCLKLWQEYNQYLIDTYLGGRY